MPALELPSWRATPEDISERKRPRDIQRDEILGLLRVRGGRSNLEEFAGMVCRSHRVLWGGRREKDVVTGLEAVSYTHLTLPTT